MKTRIGEVLRRKGSQVYTVGPENTLLEAVNVLVHHGVGSLVVTEGERIHGILTERDVLRESARRAGRLEGVKVAEVMTRHLIVGEAADTVEEAMKVMTKSRIRHLPILEKGRLAGIISIGDAVKALLDDAEVEIKHLSDYIRGKYPG